MALVTPLVVATGAADGISILKLTVVWWLGLVGWGLWAIWALCQRHRLPLTVTGIIALVFAGTCALATVFSMSPQFSLLGLPMRYNGLLPIVSYIAVMWLVIANYSEQPDMVQGIVTAIAVAGTIMSIYIVFQAAGLDWTHWKGETGAGPPYPIGTMGNSNFAGGYLAVSMPICLCYLLAAKVTASRLLFTLSLGVQGLALWYTQTRGGMLAAVVALIAILVAGGWRFIGSWMRGFTIALFAIVLCSAAVVISRPPTGVDGPLADSRTSTLESRLAFWGGAFEILTQNPVVGTGLDTFYASYLPIRPTSEAVQSSGGVPDSPHNVFLGYAANAGALGILAYLAVIGTTLYFAFRRLRRLAPRIDIILLALVGALIGYLVQGAFSIDEPPMGVLQWLLIGCIVVRSDPLVMRSWRRRPQEGSEPGERPVTRRSRNYLVAVGGGIGLVVVASLVFVSLPLVASVRAHEGRLRAAMDLQPWDASYPEHAGDAERTAGLAARDSKERARHFAQADSYYRRSLEAQPDAIAVVFSLAQTNAAWAESVDPLRFALADRWWRRALSINPHDPGLRQRVEDSRHEMEAAGDSLAKTAADGGVTSAAGWTAAARAYAAAHDFSKARGAIEATLRLNPGDQEATQLMAMVASDEAVG